MQKSTRSRSKSENQLTVVVPVFNEDQCLDNFYHKMNEFLSQTPIDTTVLIVNDGSTDRSQAIIEKICSEDKRYRFLTLASNSGLSTTLKAGIDNCHTSLFGYIDADIQTSPLDLLNFLEFFPEYDLVNGIRKERKDNVIKRYSSHIANTFRRMMIHDNIEDTCCPLKIIKTDFARKIPFFVGMHRFIPALVQLEGGKIKELPVQHFPRYAGRSKYDVRNRIIGAFIDTLVFLWIKKRYIRYRISKHSVADNPAASRAFPK